MTVPILKGAAMELEIKKLEKAVRDLTVAIAGLTASINAQKINGNRLRPIVHNGPIDLPKTVCTDTLCGAINSENNTCDHTLARYRSEYNCG